MLRPLLLTGCLTLASCASWVQVGQSLTHASIVASALDFDEAGAPMLAYGYMNATTGGTTISFNEWNATKGVWQQVAVHASQFPQVYDNFLFRTRDGILYLGLDIGQDEDLASVLRGEGGYDGFEGAYAWQGSVFDYEINSSGDMRLVFTPDNSTLLLVTYNHTGWDTYPATDTYGPNTTLVSGSSAANVDDVVVCRAEADDMYVVYVDTGHISAVRTTLSNTSTHVPVAGGAAGRGDHVGVAAGAGMLCVSSIAADASLQLVCAGRDSVSWTSLIPAGLTVDPGLPSAVSIERNGTVVVAALSAHAPNTVSAVLCPLSNATGALACPGGWQAVDYVAGASVTNFGMKGLYLTVTETTGQSDTMAVVRLT